jgi:glycosyltransferase involved in cell wall biosynthesis
MPLPHSIAPPESPGPRRIGLDARNLHAPNGTGVATYTATLARACENAGYAPQLLTAPARDGKSRRFARALLPYRTLAADFSAPDIFRTAQVHFNIYGRPLRLRTRTPPTLMHWTYPLPLYLAGCPNIVTVHDLIPLTRPDLTGIDAARMRRILQATLRRAAAIVTVSQTVRAELTAQFGIAPERVTNLYQAVDITLEDGPEICPPGSLLAIGTVEPRKNIARLIAAHAASGVPQKLVIIGPDGQGAAGELAGAGPQVLRVPYAPRAALLRAMARCGGVLFPSLAEGFGLPIAEAFALGVPVMTSRGGATEEIAGGAASLVDPYDIQDMARAIAELAQNDALRDRLKSAGLARATHFTLDAYAARLRAFYDHILHTARCPLK